MRRMNPGEYAEKQIRRLSAAGPDIRAGVAAVSENPCDKAADKADDWQAAMTLPRTRARFEAGLRRVSLADWKSKMLDVGLGRVAQGAEAARPKMEKFASEFLPHVYDGAEKVKAMPGLTLEDGIARATAMIRHNAEFVRS